MSVELCEDLVRRYDRLKAERGIVEQVWREIETFVAPYRGQFLRDNAGEISTEWGREDVYDSTAIVAHQNLAARLHGALSNPAVRWFEIRFRDDDLNKDSTIAEWLALANEVTYYALQDSNFNLEVNETYQDICGFGTSPMLLESSKTAPLMFKSIPLKEVCFEDDWDGRVLRFYRLLEMTPAQIISKFGEDGTPEDIIKMDGEGKQEKQEVLYCVYPRDNKIIPLGKKASPSRRPWAYCYILKEQSEMLGKEGGYYEMPVFIPRWRKTNNSAWGNSPANLALADIKTLNRVRRMQLDGSEKKIDPPILAEDGALFTDLNLSASTLNTVLKIDGIKSFDSNFDLFVSDAMVQQLQSGIRDYFFYDQLMLPQPQGTPATAYEISVRYEQMQKLLGPTMGRLQNDLLDPIVSRAFRLLARSGQIPPPPQQVIDAGADLEVEYIGALSNAQRADRAASIERYAVSMANMSTVMPEVLDVVDQAALSRQMARDLGIPPDVLRGDTEVEEIQKTRQDAQKEAARAEIDNMNADTESKRMGAGQPTLPGQ